MELCKGEDLGKFLTQRRRTKRLLSEHQIAYILNQILRGLQLLH